MTIETYDERKIKYPTADQLDTGGVRECTTKLYLIPAEETRDGVPEITYHYGVGNIGTPMPAWHNRWASIGYYGPQAVGESVLAVLKDLEEHLVAVSDSYLGSEWDGSNHVGRWEDDDERLTLGLAFEQIELSYYWDCADYWAGGGRMPTWEEICDYADTDPSDTSDAAIGAIVEAIENDDSIDAELSGAEEFVRDLADSYEPEPEDEDDEEA